MKLTKMTIFAVIVSLISIIFFMTFNQEAFTAPVPAKLLFFKTREFPVLYYIAGAFIFGLTIGVVVAINEHFVMASKLKKVTKEFNAYKKEVAAKESEENSQVENDE